MKTKPQRVERFARPEETLTESRHFIVNREFTTRINIPSWGFGKTARYVRDNMSDWEPGWQIVSSNPKDCGVIEESIKMPVIFVARWEALNE